MEILSWIVVGLLAGAIGKAIYPGHQGGGIVATIGLGLCGAITGGFIGNALFGVASGFSIIGLIVSIIGAMFCIFLWGLISKA